MSYFPPENVYGILAAPPCTMFSLARQTAKTPRDLRGAIEVVAACMRIIWTCRAQGSLQFWAMENPVGLLRQFMGKPALTFEPYWYGDRHSKRTDLWGYFNPPKRLRGVEPPSRSQDRRWQRPHCPKEYEHLGLDRAGIRAITPKHFARAFFIANT